MLKFYGQQGRENDTAVSSIVTLSRNFKDLPFVSQLDREKAAELMRRVEKALADAGFAFAEYDFTALSPSARGALAEKGLAPQSLVQGTAPRGVFASGDEALAVIVGDEDHIRIQAQCAGVGLEACLEAAQKLDDVFDTAYGYAYSEKYGYLTASPVNLGCAMRAGVAMHLPAIASGSGLRAIGNQAARMGLELGSLYGDGSCVYLLSNVKSFGISEKELVSRIESAAEKIMERERAMRAQTYKDNPEYLENRVYRALGILGSARLISTREATALLSDARLGAGVLPGVKPEKLDAVFRMIGPCAVGESAQQDGQAKTEVKRASLIRAALSDGNEE